MAYDDANASVRREKFMGPTTAGATTVGGRFRVFQACRLKAVHFEVVVAGTTAGHGFTIRNGTTSIGSVTLGTSAAGVRVSATLTGDTLIPANGTMSVASLSDATGTDDFIYEYEVLPSAVQT